MVFRIRLVPCLISVSVPHSVRLLRNSLATMAFLAYPCSLSQVAAVAVVWPPNAPDPLSNPRRWLWRPGNGEGSAQRRWGMSSVEEVTSKTHAHVLPLSIT